MINITLPDNSIKSFKKPPTGTDVAVSISEGFARNCVAMEVDGLLCDLNLAIEKDAGITLITTRDEKAIDILRHSAAHVMAQAVETLYKDAKLTIGPVVENGFYYDIEMAPVSEDDFPTIEAEMKKIIKAKLPFKRQEISKSDALELYK
ncbi:MAG: TGS domain-containing protein, partial [Deltaproteobacteria bacterium]|nr:TGS domain-containing protein [Deltaproteobacteria bacterium]